MFEEIVGESKGLSKEYKGNQSRDTSFLFESRDTSLRVEVMRPFTERIPDAARRQVSIRQAPHSA